MDRILHNQKKEVELRMFGNASMFWGLDGEIEGIENKIIQNNRKASEIRLKLRIINSEISSLENLIRKNNFHLNQIWTQIEGERFLDAVP